MGDETRSDFCADRQSRLRNRDTFRGRRTCTRCFRGRMCLYVDTRMLKRFSLIRDVSCFKANRTNCDLVSITISLSTTNDSIDRLKNLFNRSKEKALASTASESRERETDGGRGRERERAVETLIDLFTSMRGLAFRVKCFGSIVSSSENKSRVRVAICRISFVERPVPSSVMSSCQCQSLQHVSTALLYVYRNWFAPDTSFVIE